MDEQQIRELMNGLFSDFKASLLQEVDRKNSGTAASITKELRSLQETLKPAQPEPTPELTKPEPGTKPGGESTHDNEQRLTLKALQTQLKDLQTQLESERTAKEEADRRSALTRAIAAHNPISSSTLYDVLTARMGGKLKREGDSWFVSDGDSTKALDQAIGEFLSTPDGKIFLPPSGVQGSGSRESTSTQVPPATTPAKAADALMQAFSGL